jgi:hypothetical protein
LTPEQVGRFEALMLEQSSLMITGPGGQPVAFSFVPESGAVGEQAFVEALGEAGYRQFKEYDRTRGARSLVTELAGELYFSENPLTPAQTERMAQILTHNCPDYQNGGAFRSYSPLDWEGAVAEAREVLTGTQLASLSELRVRKEQVRATIEARRQGPAQTANAARTN